MVPLAEELFEGNERPDAHEAGDTEQPPASIQRPEELEEPSVGRQHVEQAGGDSLAFQVGVENRLLPVVKGPS